MKKLIFWILAIVFLVAPVWADVELDTDANNAMDVSRGGTNSTTAAGARTNLDVYSKSEVYTQAELLAILVRLTGDQTIAGVKTFSSFPVTPSSAPTTDYQVANKKYVDDNAGGTPEGTSILSTGETGGIKYLREDGDGTCSWQEVSGGAHTQNTDTNLGTLGTKSSPLDADKFILRDSADSDDLVTSTVAEIKAIFKTYFDTLYQGSDSSLQAISLLSPSAGDIMYWNGSTWVLLNDGSAGDALTSDGDGTFSWLSILQAGANETISGNWTFTGQITTGSWTNLLLEGSTADDYEHIFSPTDATADRNIYIGDYDTRIPASTAVSSTGVPNKVALDDDTSVEIMADADGMDDDEYNGITITGRNAGEALTQWNLVRLANDADPWHQADADAAGEFPAIGIVVATTSDTNEATVLVRGVVRNEGWTGLTPGGKVYLSDTAGGLTQTAPSTSGDCVQVVGFALSDSEILFDFSRPYAEVE